MKFASFPKFSLLSLLAGVLALALTGCGGTSNLNLTQGNWSVTATSTAAAQAIAPTFLIGGNLTQNKSTVSGAMYVVGSLCFPASQQIAITGAVKDKNVTLTTASFQSQVITVTATGTDPSTLTGTYTVVGGCDDGDKGTVAAVAMPSISGTWNGTLAPGSERPLGIAAVSLSVNLTQAATASTDGTFALTGMVTYTNSSCSLSGTIDSGSVAGQYIANLHVNTVENDQSPGDFSFTGATLDSASAPKNMTGLYSVGSGLCLGNADQSVTLTKQ